MFALKMVLRVRVCIRQVCVCVFAYASMLIHKKHCVSGKSTHLQAFAHTFS